MKLIITKCKFTHKYLDRYLEKTPVNDFIKIHSDTRKEILAIQAKLEVRDDKFDELVKQSDRNARKLDEMNFKEPVLLPIWLLIILFLSSTFDNSLITFITITDTSILQFVSGYWDNLIFWLFWLLTLANVLFILSVSSFMNKKFSDVSKETLL